MRRGFTAIELTVVMVVLAILAAIAMPGAGRLLDRIRVRAAVIEIESLFGAARHLAIARSTRASVEIDTIARTVAVTVGSETVRESAAGAQHGVELAANRSSMTYAATGVGYGAANLSIIVRKGSAIDTIVVSRLGRVRH